MKTRFAYVLALALSVLVQAAEMPSPATSASMPSTATEAMPGLKVGEKAADFTLKNTAGEEVALQTLLKTGNVALAFVRSADWCPFCRRQLQDLQKNLQEIEGAGVQLVAISYDSPTTNAAATAKLGLTFPLLSDTGSKVIDAYGIRNQEATGRTAGIPHPVLFILDQKGTIRVKLMRDGYRERPESSEIVAGAKSIM
ncbi:MAG: peroxiredoxin family protein [Opitutaceae bacterium]